jgi:hypothetical protein
MSTAQPTLDEILFPASEHDHRYLGRCPVAGCKTNPASTTTPHATEHRCPTHGRAFAWHRVEGRRTSRRCDSRCMYARGPDCECACAGANHGRGWSA